MRKKRIIVDGSMFCFVPNKPPVVAGVILEADANLSTIQLLWAAVSNADDRHSSYVVDTHQVHLPPGVVLLWE